MENEMKALAKGLALFLTTDLTVSGIVDGGSSLLSFADGLSSALLERKTPHQAKGTAALSKIYQSFFYRYAANGTSSPVLADDLMRSAFHSEIWDKQRALHLISHDEMAVSPLSNNFFTELVLREKFNNNQSDKDAAKHIKTVETQNNKSATENEHGKNIEKTVLSENVMGRAELNRIFDALGEQLHQKLAAGFPMYVG